MAVLTMTQKWSYNTLGPFNADCNVSVLSGTVALEKKSNTCQLSFNPRLMSRWKYQFSYGSLKSCILSSTSFQMDKIVWGVASAAVELSSCKANMVALGDGKFGPWGWPQNPSEPNMPQVRNPTALLTAALRKDKKTARFKNLDYNDGLISCI